MKQSTCGCCDGSEHERSRENDPGQPEIRYRATTHPESFARMLARITRVTAEDANGETVRPLADLTTRDPSDPSIALLDAWAAVADVVTFYQERIVNEGFLRTATERRSILELARAIGYELSPGVAAGAALAFTVEDAAGAPGIATINAGTPVQSVPGPGESSQTFEVTDEVEARAEWNDLRPLTAYDQEVSSTTSPLYVAGTARPVNPGDVLLVVTDDGATVTARRVLAVEAEDEHDRTRLDLAEPTSAPPGFEAPELPEGELTEDEVPFTEEEVRARIMDATWRESDLAAFLELQGWDADLLLRTVNEMRETASGGWGASVYVLRTRVGFFGHNAPLSTAIPTESWQGDLPEWDDLNGGKGADVWRDAQGNTYQSTDGVDVYLERVVKEVLEESWVYFEGLTSSGSRVGRAFKVTGTTESSLADFGMSAKAMGLNLTDPNGAAPDTGERFLTRKTTAFVESEALDLVTIPLEDDLEEGSEEILLDRMIPGLARGRAVILTGERADLPGVTASEMLVLDDVRHAAGLTTLALEAPLQRSYVRSTVSLNANVAEATHGETVSEVMGSGDASLANQRFTLKKTPLTFVSATNPKGCESTLIVRVDGVEWEGVDSFYGQGPEARVYVTRLDDDGVTHVLFGDGVRGARLPTGQENVVATYRAGIGLEGEASAGSLTLLPKRPFGVKEVENPLPASGAADPEEREDARENAPLTVRTLDRIVSLRDFEDYARAFPGVGKARASEVWSGETRLVHLTVAGENGAEVTDDGTLMENLLGAIASAADPGPQVRASGCRRVLFNVEAGLVISPDRVAEDVIAAAEDALSEAFAFEARGFGRPVSAAEVVATLQGVDGVIAVHLEALYRVEEPDAEPTPTLGTVLPAADAKPGGDGVIPAELLLLNPLGVTLHEQEVTS